MGSTPPPPEETIFHATFIWIKKRRAKRDTGMFQSTWHCCMYCKTDNAKNIDQDNLDNNNNKNKRSEVIKSSEKSKI